MEPAASPVMIGVAGAFGRMGQAVAAVVDASPQAVLAAAFDRPGTEGQAVGARFTVPLETALTCDVIIDFSSSEASAALAGAAAARGAPALVIGSTGWTDAAEATLKLAATRIPIVRSGNFSLGVNILAALVQEAAARLPAADWDIEIIEAHHRRKVDAPSGTALMLGQAAATGRGVELAAAAVKARDGLTGPRPDGAIGFSVVRGGGIVGEHQVVFAAEEEVITFAHSARDRSLFARGALAAALWVMGRPPGLYSMRDVLGFAG